MTSLLQQTQELSEYIDKFTSTVVILYDSDIIQNVGMCSKADGFPANSEEWIMLRLDLCHDCSHNCSHISAIRRLAKTLLGDC